jgi:hypothetical protein
VDNELAVHHLMLSECALYLCLQLETPGDHAQSVDNELAAQHLMLPECTIYFSLQLLALPGDLADNDWPAKVLMPKMPCFSSTRRHRHPLGGPIAGAIDDACGIHPCSLMHGNGPPFGGR